MIQKLQILSIKEKSVSGIVWQFLSISIQAVANIIYLMVMARLLSKEAFGVFAIAAVFVSYIAMFSEFGFGAAIIQKKNLEPTDISFTFYTNFLFSICLFSFFVLISPYASDFYNNAFTSSFLVLLSLKLILKSFSTVSNALLIRELAFKKLFYANTSAFIIGNLIIGIILAFYGFEEWALLWALLAVTFFSSLIIFILSPHSLKFNHRLRDGKYIFKYGYQLTLVRLLNQTANQSDKLIIGKLFPISILGVYERFQKVLMLPETYIGRISDGVLFSAMSKVQDEKIKIQSIFTSFLSLVSIFMAFICLYCFFFTEQIVGLVLGEKWLDEAIMFKIYSVIIFVQTFSRYADTLVRAKNEFSPSARIKFVFMLLIIVSVIIGSQFGIVEVLGGILFAKCVHSILMLNLTKSILNIPISSFLLQFRPLLFVFSVWMVKYFLVSWVFANPWLILISCILTDVALIYGFYKKRSAVFNEQQLKFIEGAASIILQKIQWRTWRAA